MSNLLLSGWNIGGFCNNAADILSFVGWILTVFKIAIPLLIIGYGMFDFGKAVVSSKDEEIKKSAKSLGMRALSGVVIFFIPSIVLWLFGVIPGYNDANSSADFDTCRTCILYPWDCPSNN